MTPAIFGVTITVGDHITRKFLGLTMDVDTIAATLAAALIVVGLGFYLKARATSGVPGKLQLAFEMVVTETESQVEGSMGDSGRNIVPIAFTLFIFILIANWLEMIPTGHSPQYLPAPSGDVNFTFALALFVIVLVHATWIVKRGVKAYILHYFRPTWWLFPINFIEELTKPITLALRLFGNIFAGGLLLVIFALAVPAHTFVPIPILDVIWKLFAGLFVAPLQAFIFALLTVLYFEAPINGGH
jgi:F-type H+-transporting ATPase subunit a